MNFTDEQQAAIDRRDGSLLLDAGAGSGKTRVLTERFARAVELDGIAVGELLTITFTEKAAAELRERIRQRLQLGSMAGVALDTESAWISTIHGFCARLLRAHALQAGVDPRFTVLDTAGADELAGSAFNAALAQTAAGPAGGRLIATYGIDPLADAVRAVHEELRARGQHAPRLPRASVPGVSVADAAVAAATARLARAAQAAHAHLASVTATQSVDAALQMLTAAITRIGTGFSSPAQLGELTMKGSGNAFKSEACDAYRTALTSLAQALSDAAAVPEVEAFDALLSAYGDHYRGLKQERSALDFEDLQLETMRLLQHPEIAAHYRGRFRRVMVDEAQDTNAVQFTIIDAITDDNLFIVGDAQQSIYSFRHADVELFRARGRMLASRGARLRLGTNFRSDPAILDVINRAFTAVIGRDYQPLNPPGGGTGVQPSLFEPDPQVELIRVPKEIEYSGDAEISHWRVAEARALAARLAGLLGGGRHTAAEVVILTRATTGFQLYEQALAERGVPTYVVGGRGYWSQQQVSELVAYLKALCSRLDTDAWYAAMLSPLCGLSLDGLVLLAAGDEAALERGDAERLASFRAISDRQRQEIMSRGAEELLHEVITATGYDIAVAARPGGRRRLANVRKLLRLARDHEAAHGPDLRAFLDWVARRSDDDALSEPEAPLAAEGIDAVRLMTIHASKGLEFPVVCVADLGRERRNTTRPLVRVGGDTDDAPVGLLVKRPGTPVGFPALDYERLASEQNERELEEERRLFYVAMTRAEQRLILSGAGNLSDPSKNRSAAIGWIAPLLEGQYGVQLTTLADHEELAAFMDAAPRVAPRSPSARTAQDAAAGAQPLPAADTGRRSVPSLGAGHRPPPVGALSYSALSTFEHCGLRFQAQYVLELPETDDHSTAEIAAGAPTATAGGSARGSEIHAVLAEIDLRSPAVAPGTGPEVAARLQALLASESFRRLQTVAASVRREQPFMFQHQDVLITGVFDAVIDHPGEGVLEVIDYKSDALHGRSAQQIASDRYSAQRLIYALAALGTGAERVRLTYLFLEAPDQPVTSEFTPADLPVLTAELTARTAPLLSHNFTVTDAPGRFICQGCPARGTLCPHPLSATAA